MNRNLKSIVIVLLLASFCNAVFAQQEMELPYKFSEPQFHGGREGFIQFLGDKLQLDKNQAYRKGVKGQCFLIFILKKDSIVEDLIFKDSSSDNDFNRQVFIAVKNSSSHWTPARVNDHPIDITIYVNIKFLLNSYSNETSSFYAFYKYPRDKVLEDAFYNEGVYIQSNSNYTDAIAYYDQAIKINSIDFDAMFNKGICYFKLGDTTRACQEWNVIKVAGTDIADKAISKYCKDQINIAANLSDHDTIVYPIVEHMPEFPGGEEALLKFISQNTIYPDDERKKRIQGTVYITFIVTKEGDLKDIRVLRGVLGGPGLDNEGVRVISIMPKWKPGTQNGKPVNVQFQLPIRYTLK